MAISEALTRWVEDTAGGRVVAWERPAVGGSRELYFLDVSSPDGTRSLVLRIEAGSAFSGTEISVSKEAAVYRALAGAAVPTPGLVALAADGGALLLERLEGGSDLSEVPERDRGPILDSLTDAIVALHALDVDRLAIEGFPRPTTPEDHARLDLAVWEQLARTRVPNLDPLIRYAGAWLRANAPRTVPRTVLVQGDTGPGNFVFAHGRVTGLIDWEFSHFGDPHDDLAWLEYRWRSQGFGADELERQLARYRTATELSIDPAVMAYYRVAVQYRCAVTTSLAVSRGGGARGLAPYLLQTQRYLLALSRLLAEFTGMDEPVVELPASRETPRTAFFDEALAVIRSGVKGISDRDLREQTRGAQIFLQYLSRYDREGEQIERLDAEDRATNLPFALDDTPLAERAIEHAGEAGDEAVFRYLARRCQRNARLWSDLLDRPRR